MDKRIVKITSNGLKDEVEMEVTQEQYNNYMRPWWAQQQRAKRNRDAMKEKGYSQESYEDWKDGIADDIDVVQYNIDEIIEKKMMLELLNEALKNLLPDEKKMAVNVLTNEMSLAEYARRCNISRTTMSDKKQKVLKKLRSFFGERGYEIGKD